MRHNVLAAGAAALLMLLAACGSSDAPAPGGIVVSNFAYSGSMTFKPGQQVTVTNEDSTAHTVTSKEAGLFGTASIEPGGATETFTAPTKTGSFAFGCRFHPTMQGTLVVSG